MTDVLRQEIIRVNEVIGIEEKEKFEIFMRKHLYPLFDEDFVGIQLNVKPFEAVENLEEATKISKINITIEAIKVTNLGD